MCIRDSPNADTSLTLLAQYQHDPYGGYFGFLPAAGTIQDLPGGGRIGRHFFDGSPRFDEFKRTQTALGYLLDHRIDAVWSVPVSYTHLDGSLYFVHRLSQMARMIGFYRHCATEAQIRHGSRTDVDESPPGAPGRIPPGMHRDTPRRSS